MHHKPKESFILLFTNKNNSLEGEVEIIPNRQEVIKSKQGDKWTSKQVDK